MSDEAREWGRAQAEKSPNWSEEKWRRVNAILGIPQADVVDVEAPAVTMRDGLLRDCRDTIARLLVEHVISDEAALRLVDEASRVIDHEGER